MTSRLEKWFGDRYQPDYPLDEPELVALDLLLNVASESPNVELINRGQLITWKGGATVSLDVAATVYGQDPDDPHLKIIIRVAGAKMGLWWRPCVWAQEGIPIADSCVSFVLMVDSDWPDECVPPTLQSAIDEVNLFLAKKAERKERLDEAKEIRLRQKVRDHSFPSVMDVLCLEINEKMVDSDWPDEVVYTSWDFGYMGKLGKDRWNWELKGLKELKEFDAN